MNSDLFSDDARHYLNVAETNLNWYGILDDRSTKLSAQSVVGALIHALVTLERSTCDPNLYA